MKDFAIAFGCSATSSTLIYPMEVLKTNFQVMRYQNKNPTVSSIIRNIWKISGPIGFYRGLAPHLVTQPVFYGVYFQANK